MAPDVSTAQRDCRVVWSRDRPSLEETGKVVTDDFELHDRSSPGTVRGPSGYRRYVGAFRSAIPDLRARVETAISGGDWVFYRRVVAGTHRRSFMGVDPSGETVTIRVPTLAKVDDDRLTDAYTTGWKTVARALADAGGRPRPPFPDGRDAPDWDDLPLDQ